jgi:hypothetical protein
MGWGILISDNQRIWAWLHVFLPVYLNPLRSKKASSRCLGFFRLFWHPLLHGSGLQWPHFQQRARRPESVHQRDPNGRAYKHPGGHFLSGPHLFQVFRSRLRVSISTYHKTDIIEDFFRKSKPYMIKSWLCFKNRTRLPAYCGRDISGSRCINLSYFFSARRSKELSSLTIKIRRPAPMMLRI